MILLFDLDGTLIDSTEAILEGFDVAFTTHKQKTPAKEHIKALIGHPLNIMFKELGILQQEIPCYIDAYKQHYRTIHTQKTSLLPHAKKAVQNAASIASLGIVTTKTGVYSQELLEHLGLSSYFRTLVGREHVTYPKPHPEPILKALSQLSHGEDEKVYMIGDTCMDMQSAASANVAGIGVLCGYGDKKSLATCTKHITPNAYEAVELIRTFS